MNYIYHVFLYIPNNFTEGNMLDWKLLHLLCRKYHGVFNYEYVNISSETVQKLLNSINPFCITFVVIELGECIILSFKTIPITISVNSLLNFRQSLCFLWIDNNNYAVSSSFDLFGIAFNVNNSYFYPE